MAPDERESTELVESVHANGDPIAYPHHHVNNAHTSTFGDGHPHPAVANGDSTLVDAFPDPTVTDRGSTYCPSYVCGYTGLSARDKL
jgi:hypothetical protein